MHLCSFRAGNEASYGLLQGDRIRAAGPSLQRQYADLRSLLSGDALQRLTAGDFDRSIPTNDVEFLPVVPQPDKILCVGVNFKPHIEEMGRAIPDYPVVFVRFPGSQTGHAGQLQHPMVSEQFDYEGELAVVIGKPARHVARQDALEFIAGYTCFMDGSVRDWQRHTPQFTAGKNFHHSGAMGPALVTADEISDPRCLQLTTRVNDVVKQQGAIADLVFDIPRLIEYCSTFTELLPGDVIATGTPGGVGAARQPPEWLRPGDSVSVEIPGVGILRNEVCGEERT